MNRFFHSGCRDYLAFMLTAISISLFCPHAHAAWEVTRFVVYEGPPIDAEDWREQEDGNDDPEVSPVIVREIENFLYATANLYSRLGFADPVANGFLDSVVERENGESAVRVYLYPLENAPGGWYSSGHPCAQPATSRRVININALRYADSEGGISDANYQTLAHELVHAVQAASEFSRSQRCGKGKWLIEGTADALGYYAVRQLRNLQFENEMQDAQFLKIFGGRHYSIPLNEPPDSIDEAYATSSFWRHLAEVAWASGQGKTHPGSASAEEDYRYLAEFFDTPYPYGKGPGAEITWVNGLMRKSKLIRADMPTIYARFVAAFADHINTRIPSLGLVPDVTQRQDRWLNRVFGSCPVVGVVGEWQPRRHSRNLAPNSAACFKVDIKPGTAGKSLQIQVQDTDRQALEQLQMGMMDGSFVSAPMIVSHKGGQPPHIASWTFPVMKDAEMIFIVSSMARQPTLSKMHTFGFNFMVGNFTHNLGTGPVGPQSPSSSASPAGSSVPVPASSKPTRRELSLNQASQAIANPVANLAPVTKVDRRQYDKPRPCEGLDRRFNRCSAKLVVTMELSPVSAQGNLLDGRLSEMMPGQMGIDLLGNPLDGAWVRSAHDTVTTLENLDASSIRIEIPRIEYGFEGELENARIRVNKAYADRDAYLSYGPAVRVGGRSYRRPPNGRVTIEEYQPTVLRGQFSANLIDEENPGPDDAPIVSRSIQGSFLVPAPWQGDDDFELDEDHARLALIQNMVQQTPFAVDPVEAEIEGMGAPPKALCEFDVDEDELDAMGFLVGCDAWEGFNPPAALPACKCSCDQRESGKSRPACRSSCETAWLECDAPPPVFPDDIEAQVELFKASMVRKNMPDYLIETMVSGFRAAPEYQRRLLLEQYQ